jgi:hypothetical protein
LVEAQKSLPALAGRADGRVMQQVSFSGEAEQNRHCDASPSRLHTWLWQGIDERLFPALGFPIFGVCVSGFFFQDQLGNEKRGVEVWERVTETLRGV